jgi:hypothetical protein
LGNTINLNHYARWPSGSQPVMNWAAFTGGIINVYIVYKDTTSSNMYATMAQIQALAVAQGKSTVTNGFLNVTSLVSNFGVDKQNKQVDYVDVNIQGAWTTLVPNFNPATNCIRFYMLDSVPDPGDYTTWQGVVNGSHTYSSPAAMYVQTPPNFYLEFDFRNSAPASTDILQTVPYEIRNRNRATFVPIIRDVGLNETLNLNFVAFGSQGNYTPPVGSWDAGYAEHREWTPIGMYRNSAAGNALIAPQFAYSLLHTHWQMTGAPYRHGGSSYGIDNLSAWNYVKFQIWLDANATIPDTGTLKMLANAREL